MVNKINGKFLSEFNIFSNSICILRIFENISDLKIEIECVIQ